ncbi:hypothetical protein BDZ97DRAFT_2055316 [Flammula alnicola]|nr:hypothetical protein BDZ97DRAFT_2055316 [Flammula alnicola]
MEQLPTSGPYNFACSDQIPPMAESAETLQNPLLITNAVDAEDHTIQRTVAIANSDESSLPPAQVVEPEGVRNLVPENFVAAYNPEDLVEGDTFDGTDLKEKEIIKVPRADDIRDILTMSPIKEVYVAPDIKAHLDKPISPLRIVKKNKFQHLGQEDERMANGTLRPFLRARLSKICENSRKSQAPLSRYPGTSVKADDLASVSLSGGMVIKDIVPAIGDDDEDDEDPYTWTTVSNDYADDEENESESKDDQWSNLFELDAYRS